MQNSQALADSKLSAGVVSTLAKPLAPEDVCAGDYVTLLQVTYELPSYLWSAESFQLPHDQPVRIQLIPEESGAPLKVRSVCLRFAFVKDPAGKHQTLDLRKCRLARLNENYAKIAWKALKQSGPKSILG